MNLGEYFGFCVVALPVRILGIEASGFGSVHGGEREKKPKSRDRVAKLSTEALNNRALFFLASRGG